MSYKMEMPRMGESITEGTIIKWHKNVGNEITKDEIILEISTDKVDSEIPAPVSGKITEIFVKEGDIVEVGKIIAHIETSNSATKKAAPESKEEKISAAQEQLSIKSEKEEIALAEKKPSVLDEDTQSGQRPAETKESPYYSPLVLNIAKTENISKDELNLIVGTGVQGRITKKDILEYLKNRKPPAAQKTEPQAEDKKIIKDGIEIIPMDHIRKKIAEHMVRTVQTSPHVGLYQEVNMQNVVTIREKQKNAFFQNEGIKLTYMPFIAEALIRCLKEFPYLNASIEGDNILVKHFINLGIAVDAEQGLIVPVIKNAEGLNLTGLARAINDLATRARSRKLKPDEVVGGTFSISNFGIYGSTAGFPLINQPQVAVLGIGALEKRPVVLDDAIGIRPVMNLSLVFDHRIIDGALGAKFLKHLSDFLQQYNPDTSF